MIGKDAMQFWDEMDLRAKIDEGRKRLKQLHDAKELIWTFENVQKEIIPHSKHGKYDAEPRGMEDEAVESVVAEHETLWEEDSRSSTQDHTFQSLRCSGSHSQERACKNQRNRVGQIMAR